MTDTRPKAPPGDLAALFAETGVPPSMVTRALARLGPDAGARLREDPWRLLRVPGVGPRQADHFAREVLGERARPDDRRRGRSLVGYLLDEAARQGHTVTPPADVLTALERLRVPDARRAVEDALDTAEVIALTEEPDFDEAALEDGDLPEPEETLGLARWAMAEEAAAEGLARLTATAGPLLDDATIRTLRSGLPQDRSLALTAALRTGVTVLRGAADDLEDAARAIAGAASAHGVRAAVAAPTDRAAARLRGAGAAYPIGGLHALLEPRPDAEPAPGAPPGTVVYGRGERRPLDLDLVIVTDAAGLDVELAAVLVEACPDGAHLVLCGEPGALPPAGPGRVLDDLEASETVPVIALEPSGTGPLAALTAAVRGGELVAVEAPGKEVVIVPAASPGEAVHRTVQLVTDSIPRALEIPVDDVRVVVPSAAGEAGAAALNSALKERLNPGPGRFGGFDPGDRVLVAAPLPQAAVGENGTVTGADATGLHVRFAGGDAVIPPALTARLRPGWAVTPALGRGTRSRAVVAVFPPGGPDDAAALSRPLVATAFGLALDHLSVVQGAGPALARAVRERQAPPRRTRLARLVVQ
ncbi:helix-hairpin-helix domain-containing protein [Actinomadura sp. SCN-SB]|uniref:helix-hairpin-helix domain-containing protein n=1 Tax=Actinomadura sp. SCN-SB TaxID=3373092 RepID=UPI003752B105